jgi:hypothetical protein
VYEYSSLSGVAKLKRATSSPRRTKTEEVLEFLKARKDSAITAVMVADSLGLDRKVTATLLSRLAREGRVMKVGRGRYSMRARPSERVERRGQAFAEGKWKRAFEEIWKDITCLLGPVSDRLRQKVDGGPSSDHRRRTERTVVELRREIGARMALDIVHPIFKDIFGDNGVEMAKRLCSSGGGG